VVLAIGDKKGTIGLGMGKAGDTTLAIQKAFNDAKKHKMKLRLNKRGTIDHDVKAKYKSARVMLMPNRGRGVVVGSAMRVMVELAGMTDVTGRVLSGSKDKLNIAQATMKALRAFQTHANKQS
jgi:small subunit ribosomal protein S5